MRNSLFLILAPLLVWGVGILGVIRSVSANFRNSPGHRAQQNRPAQGRSPQGYGNMGRAQPSPYLTKQQPTVKMSAQRPQMQKGLFDMDTNKGRGKTDKSPVSGMFRNSGYDKYETKGRRKDLVTGYDRRIQKNQVTLKRARGMQYSHTYDGHEPWDKCLPKEKDPWDKDFYA